MNALPKTRPGRVACWLALAFVLWFFLVNQVIVVLRQRWDLLPRPLLIGQGFLGLALGLAASFAALVAIRRGERSLLTYLALLPGLLVAVFLLGELSFPH